MAKGSRRRFLFKSEAFQEAGLRESPREGLRDKRKDHLG